MDHEQQRLMEIFNQARAKASAKERDAYLNAACGGDETLRGQVEALLQAHTQMGDFLKPPLDDPAIQEGPSSLIGHYKLLEQIGKGGFGVVFMAEQREPIHRRVALKVIKAGMDTKEVVARFEAERQALAMMDHPSIAKVFEAGTTETGRPYFVMELVKGIPITEYCDQGNLPMPDRLQLFMQVCHAVQHAHQKGIIHRDLKPSNILITMIDGKPVPKIIDFGVAKALGQQLTEKTLFTSFQQIIGTPLYMSPEQAAISGVDVDTRSDIYSLGVLLYELLTGATPFDEETLRKAALDDMRRIIREVDPPKPSTRLQTLGDRLTEVAQHRRIEPSALPRLVHGDLDWIVMRCLEKERGRRYETANALQADIQRHLEHQPVLARRPGTVYKAQKFFRRHFMGVALVLSVTLALIVGLVASLIGFAEARRERDRAVTAEARAEQSRRQAEEDRDRALAAEALAKQERDHTLRLFAKFAENLLEGREPVNLDELFASTGMTPSDETAMAFAEASKKLWRAGKGNEAETGFRLILEHQKQLHGESSSEAAGAMVGLARQLSENGKADEAEALARRAVEIQKREYGPYHRLVSRALHELGLALIRLGEHRWAEAEDALRESIAVEAELRRNGQQKSNPAFWSHSTLGNLLSQQGRYPEAEELFSEAVAMRLPDKQLEDAFWTYTIPRLASALEAQGKYTEAEQVYRQELQRRSMKPDSRELSKGTAELSIKLGQLLGRQGKLAESENEWDEAEAVVREAIAILRRAVEHDSSQSTLRIILGHALWELGAELETLGRLTEVEDVYEQALHVFEQARKDFPTQPFLRQEEAYTSWTLAKLLMRSGQLDEAAAEFKRALRLHSEAMTDFPADPIFRERQIEVRLDFARLLKTQNKGEEASSCIQETFDLVSTWSSDETKAACLCSLSLSLASEDRWSEAENATREALAIYRKLGKEDRRLADSLWQLANLLREEGKWTEAEQIHREELALSRKLFGDEHPHTLNSMNSLATVLLQQGKIGEAEPVCRDAAQICSEALPRYQELTSDPNRRQDAWAFAIACERFGQILRQINQVELAEKAYKDAQAVWVALVSNFGLSEDYRWHLAVNHDAFGELLRASGRLDEAIEAYGKAMPIWKKLAAATDKEDHRNHLRWTSGYLADLLVQQGKWAEAEEVWREELALEKRLSGDKHPYVASSLSSLAFVLAEQGKLAEAKTNLLEALEMSSANDPALYYCALIHLRTGDTNNYRGITTRIAAQLQMAAPDQNTHLLRWACVLAPDAVADYSPVLQATRQALAGDTNTVTSYSDQQTLGALLYRAHQYDEAVQVLTHTVELGRRLDAKTLLTSPAYGVYFLTMAHAQLGHTAEARECFKRASALDPLTMTGNTNAPSQISWNRRLTLKLLRKEAESLLKSDTPDSDTN